MHTNLPANTVALRHGFMFQTSLESTANSGDVLVKEESSGWEDFAEVISLQARGSRGSRYFYVKTVMTMYHECCQARRLKSASKGEKDEGKD